jgi:hypothetical protein
MSRTNSSKISRNPAVEALCLVLAEEVVAMLLSALRLAILAVMVGLN